MVLESASQYRCPVWCYIDHVRPVSGPNRRRFRRWFPPETPPTFGFRVETRRFGPWRLAFGWGVGGLSRSTTAASLTVPPECLRTDPSRPPICFRVYLAAPVPRPTTEVSIYPAPLPNKRMKRKGCFRDKPGKR